MITKDNLIIMGIDSAMEITEFKLDVRPNHHAGCLVKFLIYEELPFDMLNDQILSIMYQQDDTEELLFKGVVSQLIQEKEGNQIKISLSLLSASIQLDYNKYIRSFQNKEQSYATLIKSILEKHSGADVLFSVNEKENQAISDLIIQYQESDWEFCKRIASHVSSVLIPDITTGQPKFYFGFSKGIKTNEEFSAYAVSLDKRYYQGKEDSTYYKDQFVFYQVESKNYYPVGTQTTLQGGRFYILSLRAGLAGGTVIFTYEIGMPVLYKTDRYYNRDLVGASLTGTVIESDAGTVKVIFDKNPDEKNIQKNYPWTPAMGNVFSCMPEPGEKVSVLFKNSNEAEAIAMETFRGNDIADCSNISSPADRYFTSAAGKEMKLVPNSIGLDNHTGNLLLLDDSAGISFQGKTMELEAKGNIIINGNKISAFAPLQTTLLKGTMSGGSINICQDFNTSGKIKFLAQATPYAEEELVRVSDVMDISTMEKQVIGMIPTGRCEEPLVHQALGMLIQG